MEYTLIREFKTLEEHGYNPSEWDTCSVCSAKPKLWLFNGGRLAACKCYGMYEKKVEAISVTEWMHNVGVDFTNFPHNELKENWNVRCKSVMLGIL